jgi:hypothetical protein
LLGSWGGRDKGGDGLIRKNLLKGAHIPDGRIEFSARLFDSSTSRVVETPAQLRRHDQRGATNDTPGQQLIPTTGSDFIGEMAAPQSLTVAAQGGGSYSTFTTFVSIFGN